MYKLHVISYWVFHNVRKILTVNSKRLGEVLLCIDILFIHFFTGMMRTVYPQVRKCSDRLDKCHHILSAFLQYNNWQHSKNIHPPRFFLMCCCKPGTPAPDPCVIGHSINARI